MTQSINRRTLAKGAAWAVPAVAVASAAPAYAASKTCNTRNMTAYVSGDTLTLTISQDMTGTATLTIPFTANDGSGKGELTATAASGTPITPSSASVKASVKGQTSYLSMTLKSLKKGTYVVTLKAERGTVGSVALNCVS